MELSIVIPTYNEKENIEFLIHQIEQLFHKKYTRNFEIIIVDDNSPDGTAQLAIKLNKKYGNIRVIIRRKRQGVGAALREGYNKSRGNLILSTDADLSFDVNDMERLIAELNKGYDLVLGSRYLSKKDYEKPDLQTKIKGFVSKYGNVTVRLLSGLNVHDFSANFRIIRKKIWTEIKITDDTHSILLEMILKTRYRGYKVTEIPVKFKLRKYGKSKLILTKIAPNFFIKLILYIFKYRILRLS